MKKVLLLSLLFFFASLCMGQKGLEGVWKGTITKGGIFTSGGYPFELFLEIEGKEIVGKSYVYLSEDEIIEMQVSGKIYQDRSMNLYEFEFVKQPDQDLPPEFNRKYQLVYNRSAVQSENTLNGYWQQIIATPFIPERKRGRIFLKKITTSKA